uniref:Membrane protein m137 n=1 Tax=Mastomys natalensis cytomegalovirus 1 TaxID=2973541 RepID=A0A9Y1ILG2_9BETA|nr:membrane protein m137 [Mastomys natalensis cytomegalovirus 1]WEG68986.1 membrane protein m137 [Mastomys natalensis cytomegalovirus 1]WEG71214.1 membrane protein m137 [Mastomys natalensis cytomegalovirus 1]
MLSYVVLTWWASAHIVTTATTHRGPFGWNPSVINFNDPQHMRVMSATSPTVLNCSFNSPFSEGVLGWMRCPPGPTNDLCRHMWITIEESSEFTGVVAYDDFHTAVVSVAAKKDIFGNTNLHTGLELDSTYSNIGGHACFFLPLVDGPVDEHVLYSSFLLTGYIQTNVLIKGPIVRIMFSIAKNLTPKTSGATILRVGYGPSIHFAGRVDKVKHKIHSRLLSCTRIEGKDRTGFSITANVTETDFGFSIEIDDGHGGLIARAGVQVNTKRDFFNIELVVVCTTVAVASIVVDTAVPRARTAFRIWCSICIGWLLRTLAG